MGRVPRNMIGMVSVLVYSMITVYAATYWWPFAVLTGGMGLFRLYLLVRDWGKHGRR